MTEKNSIFFKTELRKISDLKDCNYNPRTLSDLQYKNLRKSFEKYGYVEICAINLDNTIIAGHQRIHVMKDLGWEEKEIEVRVPNKLLCKEDFDEYLIRSNKNTGDWAYELLAENFEVDELIDWGFTKLELHLDDWESDLDDGLETQPDEITTEIIKLQVEIGKKTEILPLIKKHLADYEITIL